MRIIWRIERNRERKRERIILCSGFANSSSPSNTLGRIAVEMQHLLCSGALWPLESTHFEPTFAYFTHFSLHLPPSSGKYSFYSPLVSRWLSVIEQSRGKTFDYRGYSQWKECLTAHRPALLENSLQLFKHL